MRHQNRTKKLGRTAAHRKATLAALACALIEHKRIETTLAKAKALRSYVEPLISRAKEDSTHNRREVFRYLQDKEAIKTLFGDVAANVGDRPGGYTRVVKLGLRQGDAAEMAVIELVDFNDVKPEGASAGKRRTRRSSGRRRGGAAQPAAPAAEKATKPQAAEKTSAKAEEPQADDLTKIFGVGPVFAKALEGAGITTFAQLAEADLETLRGAIASGSDASDAAANEETWAEQARFAAAGDWDGHAAYVERLKAGEEPAEATAPGQAEPEAEAPSPQPDDTPEARTHPEDDKHADAPEGGAPGTGEPPPEAGRAVRGSSERRG